MQKQTFFKIDCKNKLFLKIDCKNKLFFKLGCKNELFVAVDFVATKKGESLISAYEKYRGMADPKVCCDYGLSIIVSYMSDKVKEEMSDLVKNKGASVFVYYSLFFN